MAHNRIRTNMKSVSPLTWTYDLNSPIPPKLTITPSSINSPMRRARGLFSWSALSNLALIYIVISLAAHVQNLRNEVAFVAEEARDLRLYGFTTILTSSPTDTPPFSTGWAEPKSTDIVSSHYDFDSVPQSPSASIHDTPFGNGRIVEEAENGKDGQGERVGRDVVEKQRADGVGTSVGRVVFGRSAWDKWSSHPA